MTTNAQIAAVVEHSARALGIDDDAAEYAAALALIIFRPRGNDRIAGLTPAQSELVWLLIGAHGRVVPYETLLDAIRSDAVSKDVLSVHLCAIRHARPDIRRCIRVERDTGLYWAGLSMADFAATEVRS